MAEYDSSVQAPLTAVSAPAYAEVVVNQGGVRQAYHYAIPDAIGVVEVGHMVRVAFGTAQTAGIVIGLSESSPVAHVKPILELLDPDPVLTANQIALARWLSEQTLAPLGACLWLMLPPGVTRSTDRQYALTDPNAPLDPNAHTIAARVLRLLHEQGTLRGAQIDHALPGVEWKRALTPLIASGVIQRESKLSPPSVNARHSRTVTLAVSAADAEAMATKQREGSGQARVLRFLAQSADPAEPIPADALIEQADANPGILKRLAEKGLITFGQTDAWRDPLAGREFVAADPPELTPAQAAALNQINPAIHSQTAQTFLLHGVTGSGKTEVYLRAIEQALSQGRGAIVLVPEIALVPQTVRRFMARFRDRVALVHSSLSDGQQFDTWRRARAGMIDVVIGARSALFTPLPNIGVIVIDEEHDSSYKQSPPIVPPYYHARDVAMHLAALHGATLILGSATPDLVTRWRADRGTIHYVHLPDRVMVHRGQFDQQVTRLPVPADRYTITDTPDALSAPLPPVDVVDMRQELRMGNHSIFSRALRESLTMVLARGEQAMLYLNRRGTATIVLCRDCGYVVKCPRCETPLTYHDSDKSALICHGCNFRQPPPTVCLECKSKRIRYFGAGTELLEKTVAAEFTDARILRWDRDTTRAKGAHEAILSQFLAGDANVLIGTQMIAKGLDIPRVTLVGVVLADTSLGLPDYRAGERAFQLLTQVAGRAGRGWLGGRVILQTYQPEHYAVRAASHHDYATFYARELIYRRELSYPPFKRLARILFRDKSEMRAQQRAEETAEVLREVIRREQLTATQLIGPAPAFFAKSNDFYRWQLLVRSTDPAGLLRHLSPAPGMFIDIDPLDIL